MRPMSLTEAAKAVGGKLVNSNDEAFICGASIASNKINKNDLFVAIKGERTDGHKYINDSFKNGASAALCTFVPDDVSGPCIVVDNTVKALQDLSRAYRDTVKAKVVGITGSVGKTSTKEIMASVLSAKFKTLKTEGNLNNEIGLPLMVLRIEDEHEVVVLEMGISDFGEMRLLSSIAKPDVCVITNIGQAHLENLKSRDGILKAKTEIFEYMNPDGAVFVNGDDDKLVTIGEVYGRKPVHFGFSGNNYVYPENIVYNGYHGSEFTLCLNGRRFDNKLFIIGEHMVLNAAAAAAVGEYLGLSDEDIQRGIKNATTISGRLNLIGYNEGYIIDDCYNASPKSMMASLDTLCLGEGRKIAVLGDMLELGDDSEKMHFEVGKYAAEHEIDVLVAIGPLSKAIYDGAKSLEESKTLLKESFYFADLDAFTSKMDEIFKKKDNILLKASNGMNFSKIINLLNK